MNTPCPPTDRMLAALDGELDEVAAAALADHVGGCSTCAAEWSSLGDAFGMLRELAARASVPQPLLERLPQRIAEARHAGRRRRRVRVGLIAATAGLAAAAVLVVLLRPRSHPATPPEPDRAVVARAADAALALEIDPFDLIDSLDSAELARLEAALARKVTP